MTLQCSLEPQSLAPIRAHDLNFAGVAHAVPQSKATRYCSYCHGEALAGGEGSEPSCYQCHGERWLDRDPDTLFAPSNHTELRGGRYYHAVGLNNPIGTCDVCHGQDLLGDAVAQTPSCYLCHEAKW
ncbi:MAG: hypothetical protein HRU19_13335 [Pseudobacteriovorax sp.]|nr:hypothetical protein [Pseudobacteriovorax sp.]